MTNDNIRTIIGVALERIAQVGGPRPTDEAARWLAAVAQQESAWMHRAQITSSGAPGPARGWWQFEQGNATSRAGCYGVLHHGSSRPHLVKILDEECIKPDAASLWRAIEGHDVVAAVAARLLLWTDPRALPKSQSEGWDTYLRIWRPGKPRPEKWGSCWARAEEVFPHAPG